MRLSRGTIVPLVVAGLVLAACGGESGTASNGDGTEPIDFTFVTGAPGSNQVLTMAALANLNEKHGHNGQFLDIAESELAVEGVARGEFDMGTGTASTTMNVIQKGADLVFIGEEIRNPWVLVGKSDITSCDDMDGVRFGLHSPGGVSTALFNAWVNENCDPSIEMEILYIAGSPNRVQGLLEDQLDATMLLVHDTLSLPAEEFPIIATLSQELPNVKTGLYYVNREFLNENRDVVVQFLAEVIAVQREVQDDPAALEGYIKEFLPERVDTAAAEAKHAVDAQLFPDDGGYSGLTEEAMIDSIEVYEEAEAIEPGLDPAGLVDLTYLEEALELLE